MHAPSFTCILSPRLLFFEAAKIGSFCIKTPKVCKEKGKTTKNTLKPTISTHRFRQTPVHLQSVIKYKSHE